MTQLMCKETKKIKKIKKEGERRRRRSRHLPWSPALRSQ